MARSDIVTQLPLDTYARIMGVPGWTFNQMVIASRNVAGCDSVVYQNGYSGDATYYVGRDEIAQAIATAESQIAAVLGFWPAPKYICDDVVEWIIPLRSTQIYLPVLRARWGHMVTFGLETFDIVKAGVAVVTPLYGETDKVTVTVNTIYGTDVESPCEVFVVFPGAEASVKWQIRPLDVSIATDGTITITGYLWQFVDPTIWEGTAVAGPANIVATVDVYRRYTDTTYNGTIYWDKLITCGTESIVGCGTIKYSRLSLFTIKPAVFTAGIGWQLSTWPTPEPPQRVEVSYLAGYDENACDDCSGMGEALAAAVVRLANIHMLDNPCGCNAFKDRFDNDRKVIDTSARMAARAQKYFGSSQLGAIFALSVLDQLDSLGNGG